MSALKVGLTLSKHVLYTLPYTIVYRRVNWLLRIKMINMKYILSTDALLYCARSTDAYKATLFDVELILHGGWISKWMSRIMCAAHCTAYKGIRKQCKWVLSTDIVRNNTISQQGCDGRYVCCDVGFAEEEEGGGGILLSFEKNESVASCVEFLQYFVFAKQCIQC